MLRSKHDLWRKINKTEIVKNYTILYYTHKYAHIHTYIRTYERMFLYSKLNYCGFIVRMTKCNEILYKQIDLSQINLYTYICAYEYVCMCINLNSSRLILFVFLYIKNAN